MVFITFHSIHVFFYVFSSHFVGAKVEVMMPSESGFYLSRISFVCFDAGEGVLRNRYNGDKHLNPNKVNRFGSEAALMSPQIEFLRWCWLTSDSHSPLNCFKAERIMGEKSFCVINLMFSSSFSFRATFPIKWNWWIQPTSYKCQRDFELFVLINLTGRSTVRATGRGWLVTCDRQGLEHAPKLNWKSGKLCVSPKPNNSIFRAKLYVINFLVRGSIRSSLEKHFQHEVVSSIRKISQMCCIMSCTQRKRRKSEIRGFLALVSS